MTVEVGTAVVTLIPSAKGFSAAIRKELGGDIGAAGGAAGDQAGGSFVKGFTGHLGTIASSAPPASPRSGSPPPATA